MILKKMLFVTVMAGLFSMVYPCLVNAQEAATPRVRPEGRQVDPQQMQQRFMDRIKESLQVNEEEWAVIKPKVEKVRNAQMSTQRMGMMGRGRQQAEGETAVTLSPMQKAAQELQTVLADKDAKPKDISARLTALREARSKAEKELSEARQELKGLLTQKQEAQLVLMGILE